MELIIVHYLALLGIILSIYFLYVKHNQSNKNYKALCDVTDKISCSKAAKSKYSNLAVLPNALYGIIFYLLVFFLPINLVFYLAILASFLSLYLIFVSIKIKVLCPVCISTYLVNFLILYFSF